MGILCDVNSVFSVIPVKNTPNFSFFDLKMFHDDCLGGEIIINQSENGDRINFLCSRCGLKLCITDESCVLEIIKQTLMNKPFKKTFRKYKKGIYECLYRIGFYNNTNPLVIHLEPEDFHEMFNDRFFYYEW